MKNRVAFTIVELLVVIAITGVLLGLLLPAVQSARESARKSQCKSNLHEIGVAMTRYLDSQGPRGKFPHAASLPSSVRRDSSDKGTWPLYEVLADYCESNQEVYRCTSDYGPLDPERDYFPIQGYTRPDSLPYVNGDSYFANEGLSYEYPAGWLQGRTRQEVQNSPIGERSSGQIWIVFDFESFHGPPGDDGSRNFLYLDGHVDALIVAP